MSHKLIILAAVSVGLLVAPAFAQTNPPTTPPTANCNGQTTTNCNSQPTTSGNGFNQNPPGNSGQYGTSPSPNNPNGKGPSGN
jgi:hypothetical protein